MNDVVIMGSGIAGNLAAAHLRKELPELPVTVVGRPDRPSPIVGESTVEYTVHFLRSLGLGPELIEKHYPKYCLTYYYQLDRGGEEPTYVVHESPAILPYPSFQLNRFTFDRDLRAHNAAAGVRAIEREVLDVQLGRGEPHRVIYRDGRGDPRTLQARWLIDATGRRRLLGRKLGLHRRPEKARSVFWFRLADYDTRFLERIRAVKKARAAYDSHFATHHFFGRGNWIWMIPMRSDEHESLISIGITWRPDLFPGDVKCMDDFLDRAGGEHGFLRDLVASGKVLDTQRYRDYLHRANRRYSADGWYLVGDAADAVDPLFSTGLMLTSVQITQVAALVRQGLHGTASEGLASDLDDAYGKALERIQGEVSDLYEVMDDPYQCHLRILHQTLFTFNWVFPAILNGYMTERVGSRVMANFLDPNGTARGETEARNALIAHVRGRKGRLDAEDVRNVFDFETVNMELFEGWPEEKLPVFLGRAFLLLAKTRLRLLLGASWRERLRHAGPLLLDVARGVALKTILRGRAPRRSRLFLEAAGVRVPSEAPEPSPSTGREEARAA